MNFPLTSSSGAAVRVLRPDRSVDLEEAPVYRKAVICKDLRMVFKGLPPKAVYAWPRSEHPGGDIYKTGQFEWFMIGDEDDVLTTDDPELVTLIEEECDVVKDDALNEAQLPRFHALEQFFKGRAWFLSGGVFAVSALIYLFRYITQ